MVIKSGSPKFRGQAQPGSAHSHAKYAAFEHSSSLAQPNSGFVFPLSLGKPLFNINLYIFNFSNFSIIPMICHNIYWFSLLFKRFSLIFIGFHWFSLYLSLFSLFALIFIVFSKVFIDFQLFCIDFHWISLCFELFSLSDTNVLAKPLK